jgi:hypothetical protein
MRIISMVLLACVTMVLGGCLSTPLDPEATKTIKAACSEAAVLKQIYEETKPTGVISASLQTKIDGGFKIIKPICDIPEVATGATVARIAIQTGIITKALIDAGVFK